MKVYHLSSLFEKKITEKIQNMEFSTQKNCDIFFYFFFYKHMLSFGEMRSQMKGHGALYLFKQKTSGKYETEIKHMKLKTQVFIHFLDYSFYIDTKQQANFFMFGLCIFRSMFCCEKYNFRTII